MFLVKLALTDTNEANVLLSHKAIAVAAAAAAAAARRTLEPRLNKDLKQNYSHSLTQWAVIGEKGPVIQSKII